MKLAALPGVSGINIAGIEYLNDASGCVNVPDEVVDVALKNGYEPCSHVAEAGGTTHALDALAA